MILAEQIALPYAAEAWEADGSLTDPYLNDFIALALRRFGVLVESIPEISQ